MSASRSRGSPLRTSADGPPHTHTLCEPPHAHTLCEADAHRLSASRSRGAPHTHTLCETPASRGAPVERLEVEGVAAAHERRRVRDVHRHAPAAFRKLLDAHRVVDLARARVVDRQRLLRKVDALGRVLRRVACELRGALFRELRQFERNVVTQLHISALVVKCKQHISATVVDCTPDVLRGLW